MEEGGKLGDWPKTPPKNHQVVSVLHSLVEYTERIDWSDHAHERMRQRDISNRDVLRALTRGEIKGEIKAGKNKDEWVCKICYPPDLTASYREIGVVVIVIKASELLIKTVMWEDKP